MGRPMGLVVVTKFSLLEDSQKGCQTRLSADRDTLRRNRGHCSFGAEVRRAPEYSSPSFTLNGTGRNGPWPSFVTEFPEAFLRWFRQLVCPYKYLDTLTLHEMAEVVGAGVSLYAPSLYLGQPCHSYGDMPLSIWSLYGDLLHLEE